MQKQRRRCAVNSPSCEAIALSIGIMAPTAAMALNGSLAAGITGSAVPLAFLLATIAVGLASFSFIQLAAISPIVAPSTHLTALHSGRAQAFSLVDLFARI